MHLLSFVRRMLSTIAPVHLTVILQLSTAGEGSPRGTSVSIANTHR